MYRVVIINSIKYNAKMQVINYLQGQVFEQVLLKYMKLLIKDMHMNYFHI